MLNFVQIVIVQISPMRSAVAGVRKDRDKHIVAELSEEEKKAGIEPQPR